MQLSRRGNRNVKAASFCLPALMFRVSTGGQSQAAFCFDGPETEPAQGETGTVRCPPCSTSPDSRLETLLPVVVVDTRGAPSIQRGKHETRAQVEVG